MSTQEKLAALAEKWRQKRNAINAQYSPDIIQVSIRDCLSECIRELTAILSEHGGGGEAVAWPKVWGVGRMFDNEKALLVIFDRKPTDDELRTFDDFAKGDTTPPTPSAPVVDDASPRFFIDHGVVHDRATGQHVGASFEDDSADRLLALLTSLEREAWSWRMAAKAQDSYAAALSGVSAPVGVEAVRDAQGNAICTCTHDALCPIHATQEKV